ncbi:hypothetical protein KGN64_003320 [Salmonella enterica]|nr:hypothetical protein [Salmonella enterica]EHM5264133.1 hypothetical protein [Salmonella enterica]EIR0277852.1 hypothetical protein [Salmonella enterica]
MTNIDERRSRLRSIRNILQNRSVNAPTNKEITLRVIAIFCTLPGFFLLHYNLWGGAVYFLCFIAGFVYKALPQIKLRPEYWNSKLDRALKEYQPLDLCVWTDFKTRVSAKGMTYEACDTWIRAEFAALHKKKEPEWSFIDNKPIGENDQSKLD